MTNWHEVSSESHFNETLKSNAKCVCVFSASWCGPCQTIKPQLKEWAAANSIPWLYVDVDDYSYTFHTSESVYGGLLHQTH
jgi:thiol-disulfide isomerase/thioredoxin